MPPTRDTGTTSVPFPTSISDYNYKLANMANTNDNHKYTHLGKYENVTEEDDREILISVGKIQKSKPNFQNPPRLKVALDGISIGSVVTVPKKYRHIPQTQ